MNRSDDRIYKAHVGRFVIDRLASRICHDSDGTRSWI